MSTHVLGWGFLALASWIAPHSWKDKPAGLKRLRWREWWRNLILGSASRRNAFRARLLAINPIFWLSSRERQTVTYPWIFLGAMAGIWLFGWLMDKQIWSELGLAFSLTYGLHMFMKSWVLTVACSSFAVDRDNGALELLLSTPLTVAELLQGQWLTLRRQFLFPVAALLLADLVWLGLGLTMRIDPFDRESRSVWLMAFLVNVGMFVADIVALSWVGMWMGVRSRHPGLAAWATAVRVLVMPWVIFAALAVVLVFILFLLGAGIFRFTPHSLILLWFVVGLAVDLVWARQAFGKLRYELRTAATQRFSLKGNN